METLPNEILDHILQLVSLSAQILSYRLISKRWAAIVNIICRRKKLRLNRTLYQIVVFYTQNCIETIPWSSVDICMEDEHDIVNGVSIASIFGHKIYGLLISIPKNQINYVLSIFKILNCTSHLRDLEIRLPNKPCDTYDTYFPLLMKRVLRSKVTNLALSAPYTRSNDGWTLLATQKKITISKLALDCHGTVSENNCYKVLELLLNNCPHLKELRLMLCYSFQSEQIADSMIFNIPNLPNLQVLDLELKESATRQWVDDEEVHLHCSKFRTEQFPSLTHLSLDFEFEDMKLEDVFDTKFASVQSLSFAYNCGVPEDANITFPNLKKLVANVQEVENMEEIVAAFPNLEELRVRLELCDDDASTEYSKTYELFASLKCLKTLQLYNLFGDQVDDVCCEMLLMLPPLHLRFLNAKPSVSAKYVADLHAHHLSFQQ